MKNLLLALTGLFVSISSYGQVASRLISSQSKPQLYSSPNFVFVNRTDTLDNRLWVASSDSLKIRPFQMKWWKDSANAMMTARMATFTPTSGQVTTALGYTPINPSGTSGQYIAGNGTMVAFPSMAPSTRSITINGVTQDMSANRIWSVGDLSSSGSYSNPSWITSLAVSKITGISAGAGISYSSGVFTNTSPDQTVSILPGSGISVTGSYPNFTVSAGNASYTYNTPTRPINSTAFQISTTKEARVSYSVTHSFALTLLLSTGSSMVYLETSANGTTGWTTISSAGYSEALAVAVAVNKTVTSNVQGVVPPGHFVRLRSVIAGGGTAAFANGQEVF